MKNEKKIDQYSTRKAIKKIRTTTLNQIFNSIANKNIDKPKNERAGNVFASRSKNGRRHIDIIGFTGLLFLDIDNCKDHIAVKQLFESIEHTVAAWYSSSGRNVHALISIPICISVEEYKSRFKAFVLSFEPYISNLAITDRISSNPTQLAFESYDPDIYINNYPEEYLGIVEVKEKGVSFDNIPYQLPTDKSEEWVVNKLSEKFDAIADNGYPQVRDYSIWLGGQVSGGYINESTAKNVVANLIMNNSYLNSQESSGNLSTYLKGAYWGIEQGIKKPIKWNSN